MLIQIASMFKFSLRSILRNRMRTLLTALGIIIGVASVIVMVGIGQGAQKRVAAQIAALGSNLLIVTGPPTFSIPNRLTQDDVIKLREESSYLRAVSGELRINNLTLKSEFAEVNSSVTGVESDFLHIKSWQLAQGDFLSEDDLASRSKVVILGSNVATTLFASSDPLGQKLRIRGQAFTVIGVLQARGAGVGGQNQDDFVLVPLSTALARLGRSQFLSMIEMSAYNESYITPAAGEIDAILRESHRLTSDTAADYQILSQTDLLNTATQTSKTLTGLLATIAGVSLLVGGIGIMNIMLVSVTERTREIGIRMAVGARKGDILLQFLTESVLISSLGGVLGILLALLAMFILGKYFNIASSISPLIIIYTVLFTALVGIFFGFYPARKAASLYPIDALRYE